MKTSFVSSPDRMKNPALRTIWISTSLAVLQQLPDYVSLIVCILESWKAPWQHVGEFLFVSVYWFWLEMADLLCSWKPAIKTWSSGMRNCFVSMPPASQVVGWGPLIMMSQCLHPLVCVTPDSERNKRGLWLVSNCGLLIEGFYMMWQLYGSIQRWCSGFWTHTQCIRNKHLSQTSYSS